MLPEFYRFQVKNETGETLAASAVTVEAKRLKFNGQAAIQYESSETNVFTHAPTIINDAYAEGATQDNSSDLFVGGHFEFEVTAPASADGNVTLFLQRSTDDGSTWDSDGLGEKVAAINFTTSGTKRASFEL